mgnify:CR=1 FL=1
MPTLLPSSLRGVVELDPADLDWLHQLVGDWQVIADLSVSDLVLWARTESGRFVAIALSKHSGAPMSVLSAVEGLQDAPGLSGKLDPFIVPISAGILIALFLVQSRGTAKLAKYFGPITAVWFLSLGALGLVHIFDDVTILRALSPYYGVSLLLHDGFLGFVILGSVFLAVTGAEALYADMGHFGKAPIRMGWLAFVLPCLTLNYLGQGALILDNPAAAENPFWNMVPQAAYWPMLILATAATVIASQAVITGAFSVTQQAVQLGLLPRIEIKRTSETQAGQIFVPAVNSFLMIGVLTLLVVFRSSHNLTAAYGVAVTGTMLVNTLMAYSVIRKGWKWPMWAVAGTLKGLVADLSWVPCLLLAVITATGGTMMRDIALRRVPSLFTCQKM